MGSKKYVLVDADGIPNIIDKNIFNYLKVRGWSIRIVACEEYTITSMMKKYDMPEEDFTLATVGKNSTDFYIAMLIGAILQKDCDSELLLLSHDKFIEVIVDNLVKEDIKCKSVLLTNDVSQSHDKNKRRCESSMVSSLLMCIAQ